MERLDALEEFTRQRSASRGPRIPVESNATVDRFLAVVRQRGEELHALVHPEEGVNRFLGNASFHASAVFDDPRLKDLAFVSQRNVDKRTMGLDSFVEVNLSSTEEGMLGFRGDVKPSVDSPIQVRLYEMFPNVNFILHTHVYVEGAPFTQRFVPCGSLEEIKEVLELVGSDRSKTKFAVNLLGHGSIILAKDPAYLEQSVRLRARPAPERLNTDGTAVSAPKLLGAVDISSEAIAPQLGLDSRGLFTQLLLAPFVTESFAHFHPTFRSWHNQQSPEQKAVGLPLIFGGALIGAGAAVTLLVHALLWQAPDNAALAVAILKAVALVWFGGGTGHPLYNLLAALQRFRGKSGWAPLTLNLASEAAAVLAPERNGSLIKIYEEPVRIKRSRAEQNTLERLGKPCGEIRQ